MHQEGATEDGMDSFGRRQVQRRRYEADPCRRGRGSRGDVDGEQGLRDSQRFDASLAAPDIDDNDDDNDLYGFHDQQRQPSGRSTDDEGSVQSDEVMAEPGDLLPGRGVAIAPVTLPGPHHVRPPYATSSVSSGTGN